MKKKYFAYLNSSEGTCFILQHRHRQWPTCPVVNFVSGVDSVDRTWQSISLWEVKCRFWSVWQILNFTLHQSLCETFQGRMNFAPGVHRNGENVTKHCTLRIMGNEVQCSGFWTVFAKLPIPWPISPLTQHSVAVCQVSAPLFDMCQRTVTLRLAHLRQERPKSG